MLQAVGKLAAALLVAAAIGGWGGSERLKGEGGGHTHVHV